MATNESPAKSASPGHLGGEWPGGDPAGQYPALWDWLITVHGVRSVIDVGCGEGHAMEYFRERGCLAHGVDGVFHGVFNAYIHDYTAGPLDLEPPGGVLYDLCWSCEFVEHVEERYVSHFLETFQAAKLLLLTHAIPGQPGHHHVNCRESNYWLDLLANDDWTFDPDLTRQARALAREANDDPRNYFAATGLALWHP